MSSPIGRSVNTQHSAISELTAQNLYNAAKEYAQQKVTPSSSSWNAVLNQAIGKP